MQLNTVICTILIYRLCQASQPEVTLQQGKVRGLYTAATGGRLYASFLGIPYAKPPVGKHRFKESLPANPWVGTYNATRNPPVCLQYDLLTMGTPHDIHGSEDCLYINVYTPRFEMIAFEEFLKIANKVHDKCVLINGQFLQDKGLFSLGTEPVKQKLLDVIVLIHGGCFMFFSSSDVGPSILLNRDVVFVTFNYRLGPLGFMSTGDAVVPGNNGMKDQVLALKWIQQNIAAFGGDPNSVTIAGFSAGSSAVDYHLLSPLSKGLFKSAICASGTSFNPWSFAENVREKTLFVARELGCPTMDSLSMVKCLRNRPAEHIVEMSKQLMPWLYFPNAPYALVVEPPGPNAFLPDTPINILKNGNATDVPVLFTFTKDEGVYPGAQIVSNPQQSNALKTRWNELLPLMLDYNYTASSDKAKDEVSQKIKEFYNIDLNTKEGRTNFIKAVGDRTFVHGTIKSAKLHASSHYSSPVYLYRFSYSGKCSFATLLGGGKELGVSHADDIIYILDLFGLNTQETEEDREVSKVMVNLWVSFAANSTLDGQTINNNLPKVTYTDIQGPSQFVPTLIDELGEEKFWDSLNLRENIEIFTSTHDEF